MIAAATVAVVAVGIAAYLQLRLSFFTPTPRPGLRVLMYHRVTDGPPARYAMPLAELRRQLEWLRERGYAVVSLRAVLDAMQGGPALPPRAVLITFDDGSVDTLTLACPVLRELGMTGVLFAVPGWAGTEHEYGGQRIQFLDGPQLRELARSLEIALHGFDHRDLSSVEPEEVEADLRRSMEWLEREAVPHHRVLAYPYGGYPKKDPARRDAFFAALRRAGVAAAFRIGNRVNPVPLRRPFELFRTEIQGDEPFWMFKWKVWKGRAKAL